MLKDLRNLGEDLKKYFLSINSWPEISFTESDKLKILHIKDVVEVYNNSFRLKIDANHCIVPSQYILYAVLMKEFAIALRQHIDLFDLYKQNKSREEIGEGIASGSYISDFQAYDEYSKQLVFKPIIDEKFNFGAKSIINGQKGSYSVRGSSDFFGSVILKIINIPDSSSSILGRIIYSLAGQPDLYSYLEKRFAEKLPFIIKDSNTNKFAFKFFSFLFQYNNLERFKDYLKDNNDPKFKTIDDGDHKLTSVFRVSGDLLSPEDLSAGDKLRFFNTPVHLDEQNQFYYLSNQWTSEKDRRLDLSSLKELVLKYYPEFSIEEMQNEILLKGGNAVETPAEGHLEDLNIEQIYEALASSGLQYSRKLVTRFVCSLLTKPFVILTGLSGSGKTKLAQSFVQWISKDEHQYCIVPVGADWTTRDPLLGYQNALKSDEYIKPENGSLDLILHALMHPDLPHFLILDEMNLSHVERYFADFLSVMESKSKISLHSNQNTLSDVPPNIIVPGNLYVIGTVNIDETTSMFSPKVLDRANTIEFRISENEMTTFFTDSKSLDMSVLNGKGGNMGYDFQMHSLNKSYAGSEEIFATLMDFFNELKKTGAEFGYRTATEMLILIAKLSSFNPEFSMDECIDIAVVQKLLPKLHGSRRKLSPVLEKLGGFCVKGDLNVIKDVFENTSFDFENSENLKYILTLEKLSRMYKNAIESGFTSFAEA